MSEQVLLLPPDTSNTGKKVRTIESSVGGNTVQQQVMVLANSSAELLEDTTAALPVKHGQKAASTGSITTSSTAITCTVTNHSYVQVQITGTHAGINFGFSLSPDSGTTYHTANATRVDTGAVEAQTGVITANA